MIVVVMVQYRPVLQGLGYCCMTPGKQCTQEILCRLLLTKNGADRSGPSIIHKMHSFRTDACLRRIWHLIIRKETEKTAYSGTVSGLLLRTSLMCIQILMRYCFCTFRLLPVYCSSVYLSGFKSSRYRKYTFTAAEFLCCNYQD